MSAEDGHRWDANETKEAMSAREEKKNNDG